MSVKPIEDFEYLIHHIDSDEKGREIIHHCLLYDHIGNLFEQEHLLVKNGVTYIKGKKVRDGVFHLVYDLEPTQKVNWSDAQAEENKIRPKKMFAGMTHKEKSKEW